ncbi:MAG: inositol 2-dehydrogenase [Caldilineaceae bacterium]|nr:inositol 2-dehydrogenase [Caldilineaceae bacterium]
MTKPITLGLIGAGRIGRVHAESITRRLSSAKIQAVSDVVAAAAQQCAADFAIPVATADHRTLLADPAIDAVVICSSTDTHTRLIVEAAEAGKHIFCEKPIALDLAAIDHALATVERCGVKLQIGFNRRFDSNFRQLHEVVRRGDIGTPQLLRITSRDPAPPPLAYVKVSGGIFLDMTIHDFDMARYLMGSEVEEVYAAGAVLVDPAIGAAGDVDTAVITLRFANGALGVIDNSRQAVYGYDQRAEVFGSAGAIEAQNKQPYQTIQSTAAGVQQAKPLYFFLERYLDAYVAEMRAFIDAIQQDTTPPVTGWDGRAPVVIGLAALRSCQEKRPVRLTEIDPQ